MGSKGKYKLLPVPWEDNSLDTEDMGLQMENFRSRDLFCGYCNDWGGEQ